MAEVLSSAALTWHSRDRHEAPLVLSVELGLVMCHELMNGIVECLFRTVSDLHWIALNKLTSSWITSHRHFEGLGFLMAVQITLKMLVAPERRRADATLVLS
jgi:hypothetical protein